MSHDRFLLQRLRSQSPRVFSSLLLLAASVLQTAPAAAQYEPWQCGAAQSLSSTSWAQGNLQLNNFHIHESTGLMSGRPYIELTFSAVNRDQDAKFLSVQFIGMSDTLPLFAISASPTFDIVGGNSAEQVSASVNSRPGDLRTFAKFCFRVDGSVGSG